MWWICVIFLFALLFLVIGSAGKPQTLVSAALLRTAAWSCSPAPCKLKGRRTNKPAYLLALAWWPASQPLQESGGFGGGAIAGSDLRTRTAENPQVGRICAGISWWFLGENLSSPLFTGFEKVFKRNLPAIPSKINGIISRKIAAKSAEKSAGKSCKKFRQKIHQKIRQIRPGHSPKKSPENPPKIHHKICHGTHTFQQLWLPKRCSEFEPPLWRVLESDASDVKQEQNKHFQMQN